MNQFTTFNIWKLTTILLLCVVALLAASIAIAQGNFFDPVQPFNPEQPVSIQWIAITPPSGFDVSCFARSSETVYSIEDWEYWYKGRSFAAVCLSNRDRIGGDE